MAFGRVIVTKWRIKKNRILFVPLQFTKNQAEENNEYRAIRARLIGFHVYNSANEWKIMDCVLGNKENAKQQCHLTMKTNKSTRRKNKTILSRYGARETATTTKM